MPFFVKELLIIKPSSFGDIIHGLHVAQALREQCPQVRISWVVRDAFAPLIQQCPTVNGALFVFERHGGIPGVWRLFRHLRQYRFDAVLDLQGLARSGLMLAATQSPLKLARADAREGSHWAATHRVDLPEGFPQVHAVSILSAFLPPLGLEAKVGSQLTFLPESNLAKLAVLERPVVLFPDSRRPEKMWPGFSELTRRLLDAGHNVHWLGLPGQPDAAPFLEHERFRDLRGETSLGQLPSLVQAARAVVANDSGPMHLAAALGKPLLALFGPTDPVKYGPWPPDNPVQHVIQAPNGELRQLQPALVYDALSQLLDDCG